MVFPGIVFHLFELKLFKLIIIYNYTRVFKYYSVQLALPVSKFDTAGILVAKYFKLFNTIRVKCNHAYPFC